MPSLLGRLQKLEDAYRVANDYKWLYITMTDDASKEGIVAVVYDISNKSTFRMENPDKMPTREFIQMCEDEWGVEMMDDYYSSHEELVWYGESQRDNKDTIRIR